ncbi:MAG: AAA family ATPase [Bacilli bacterium]|nr:AAA family ATPase [Bacilli bacterium]
MFIKFQKVVMHNFLSYGHSEIDLTDKRYCLVSGINNDKKDNASSNGAGKSSWGSAICWALTGETIQGISSGIKNIHVQEDLCYVELHFSVDNNEYKITRYKNPKSNLKIIVNDQDVSGKGIRESEEILNNYIPDLTSQLLGSIIILGQGLPHKFSNNTPSGRKGVLEKLSKSDFMIEDLKERISERSTILNKNLRDVEDKILTTQSNKTLLEKQIIEQEDIIKKLSEPRDFDLEILNVSNKIEDIMNKQKNFKTKLAEFEADNNTKNNLLAEKNKERLHALSLENAEFDRLKSTYFEKRSNLMSSISSLTLKISDLKSIKDTCPTCGQNIPNVVKPTTDKEEQELKEITGELEKLNNTYTSFEKTHQAELQRLDQLFNVETAEILSDLKNIKQQMDLIKAQDDQYYKQLVNFNTEVNKIKLEKEQFINNMKNAEKILYNLKSTVEKLESEILYNNSEKETLSKHISVVNQMSTLIKRDFRGYLLSNVISYIESKVKEYSLEIFGTDSLTVTLEGNNINISYCNKPFENLSGGERQRVDLILQFAIRDMMRQYLNFSSNILLLDEIFDSLDVIAVDAVLRCICNKLADVESLFIISHHARELEIPYDSELIITKDENGISNINWR